MNTPAENKKEFLKIVNENIKREGIAELLAWLESTDFFTAPASSKNHLHIEGGLVLHSINVYNRLKKMVVEEFGENQKYSNETVAVAALFHDVCKAEFYKVEMRNKKENGEWVQVPTYIVDEKLPYGHGEKSVYIVNGFLRLSREEAIAINWHMGGFDARAKGGSYSIGEAYDKFPLAVMLHLADMQATYLDENPKI